MKIPKLNLKKITAWAWRQNWESAEDQKILETEGKNRWKTVVGHFGMCFRVTEGKKGEEKVFE